jgi:hypothetical protein
MTLVTVFDLGKRQSFDKIARNNEIVKICSLLLFLMLMLIVNIGQILIE